MRPQGKLLGRQRKLISFGLASLFSQPLTAQSTVPKDLCPGVQASALTNAHFNIGSVNDETYPASNGINGLKGPYNCHFETDDDDNYPYLYARGLHDHRRLARWEADLVKPGMKISKIQLWSPDDENYYKDMEAHVIGDHKPKKCKKIYPLTNLHFTHESFRSDVVYTEFDCFGVPGESVRLTQARVGYNINFLEVGVTEFEKHEACHSTNRLINPKFNTNSPVENVLNGQTLPQNCGDSVMYSEAAHSNYNPATFTADIKHTFDGAADLNKIVVTTDGEAPHYETLQAYSGLGEAFTRCPLLDIEHEYLHESYTIVTFNCKGRPANSIKLIETADESESSVMKILSVDVEENRHIPNCEQSDKLSNARFVNGRYSVETDHFRAANAINGLYIPTNCKTSKSHHDNTRETYAIGKHSNEKPAIWMADIKEGFSIVHSIKFYSYEPEDYWKHVEAYSGEGGLWDKCEVSRVTTISLDESATLVEFRCQDKLSDAVKIVQTADESVIKSLKFYQVQVEADVPHWSLNNVPAVISDYIHPQSNSVCIRMNKNNGDNMCNLFKSCFFGFGNWGKNLCPDSCDALQKDFPRDLCGSRYRMFEQRGNWWRIDEDEMKVCFKRGGHKHDRFAEVCTNVQNFIDLD